MIFALCIGKYVVQFITAPVERQLQAFYDRSSQVRYQEYLQEMKREGFYAPNKRFRMTFDREQLKDVLSDRPLVREPGAATIYAFERLLDQLDVGHVVDPKVYDKQTSRAELDVAIQDPSFDAFMVRLASKYGRPQHVSTFNVTEAFMVYFKVSLVTGLVIGSPWIFFQIWSFIAVGLYPHEKKYVNYYLPFSIGLFLAGAALCEFAVLPKAIEVLLSFNEWMGLEPDLRLNEWLGFAMMMPLIFGISFQTPLVMLFTDKIGIIEADTYRSYRKIAWFVLAIIAAVITPTVDAVSMLFLWVPLCFLYELGIILARFQTKTPFEDVETPEAEEMVEV
jgi:sec-independent protein translocase protein TatC